MCVAEEKEAKNLGSEKLPEEATPDVDLERSVGRVF